MDGPRLIRLTTFVLALTSGSLVAQEPVAQEPEQLSEVPAGASTEQPQELTRGPLHEAFAETYSEPEPGLIVKKVPPDQIVEIPPSHRPDGDDVVWIPGYWGWDEAIEDFIWVSGVWRKVPPGRTWVPGYWQDVEGGRQWISGFWRAAGQGDIEYVPTPPASAESGPSSPAPSDDHFYVPGCWRYVDGEYRWRPGFWNVQHDGWAWIPHRYVWTQRGCIFRSGYWDYLLARRGILFAPLQFSRSFNYWRSYRYTPSCVIDVGPSLLVHLFVRPGYCHYYFGDYYAARYRQARIYPWVNCWQQYRHYDPLFAYYYYDRARRNSVIYRVHGWHDHFHRHEHLRPAHHFAAQRGHPGGGSVTQVASLGRSFEHELQRPGRGRGLVRVSHGELAGFRQQADPHRRIRRLRAAVEADSAAASPGSQRAGQPAAATRGDRPGSDPIARRNQQRPVRDAPWDSSSIAGAQSRDLRDQLNQAIGSVEAGRAGLNRRRGTVPLNLDQLDRRRGANDRTTRDRNTATGGTDQRQSDTIRPQLQERMRRRDTELGSDPNRRATRTPDTNVAETLRRRAEASNRARLQPFSSEPRSNRPESNRAGSNRAGSNRSGLNRSGVNTTGQDRSGLSPDGTRNLRNPSRADQLRREAHERIRRGTDTNRREATVNRVPGTSPGTSNSLRGRSFPQFRGPGVTASPQPRTTFRTPNRSDPLPRATVPRSSVPRGTASRGTASRGTASRGTGRAAPGVRTPSSPRPRTVSPPRGAASLGGNRATTSSRNFGGSRSRSSGAGTARNLGGAAGRSPAGRHSAAPTRSFSGRGSNRSLGSGNGRSVGGGGAGSRGGNGRPDRN